MSENYPKPQWAGPLKVDKTYYEATNAYWMARLSVEAYKKRDESGPDEAAIIGSLRPDDNRFIEVKGYNAKSSQGIVVRHEDYVAVAFRGTDEIGDWFDNIAALEMKTALGGVHGGFQRALMDIWPEMKHQIRRYRNEVQDERRWLPLWITGHSLGGAMATLAAADLIVADRPFMGVYTFGQPRVGDRDFARAYTIEAGDRTFRFQNNNDIVTRVPARVMGYSHVGTYIYINESGDTLERNPGAWYRFLDMVQGVVDSIGKSGIDGIEDHNMRHYIRAIDRYGDKKPEGF